MSTTMIAIILLASLAGIICALVYTHQQHKRKERAKLLHQFSLSGTTYGLSFSSQELLHNSIIGLDGIRRKLLYIKAREDQWTRLLIDLEQIKTCTLKKTYQNYPVTGSKEKREAEVQDITLEFAFIREKQPVSISFYNVVCHNIYQMAELEEKAREWQILLSKMLNLKEQRA